MNISLGHGEYKKLGFLSLLVFINLADVLVFKRSSNFPSKTKPYIPSIILLSEFLKLAVDLYICLRHYNITDLLKRFRIQWRQKLVVMLIALIYCFQNNLNYFAMSRIPGIVFQILNQFKIVTTAFFFVLFFNKKLSRRKWIGIFLLLAGIISVQYDQFYVERGQKIDQPGSVPEASQNSLKGYFFGVIAAILATFTSAFAAGLFEKLLKDSNAPFWVLNMDLALFSVLIWIVKFKFDPEMESRAFFDGFNGYTYLSAFLMCFSGLTISIVVKIAGNILKCFSISISTVLLALINVYNGHQSTWLFKMGILAVVIATNLYGTWK